MKVINFRGQYYFLSNLYETPIEYYGGTYPSVENAFQSQRCYFPQDKQLFLSIEPHKARALADRLRTRDNFEFEKEHLMYELIRIKFRDKQLAQKLIETYDYELVEDSDYYDDFWGRQDGIGENKIGEILMSRRWGFICDQVAKDKTIIPSIPSENFPSRKFLDVVENFVIKSLQREYQFEDICSSFEDECDGWAIKIDLSNYNLCGDNRVYPPEWYLTPICTNTVELYLQVKRILNQNFITKAENLFNLTKESPFLIEVSGNECDDDEYDFNSHWIQPIHMEDDDPYQYGVEVVASANDVIEESQVKNFISQINHLGVSRFIAEVYLSGKYNDWFMVKGSTYGYNFSIAGSLDDYCLLYYGGGNLVEFTSDGSYVSVDDDKSFLYKYMKLKKWKGCSGSIPADIPDIGRNPHTIDLQVAREIVLEYLNKKYHLSRLNWFLKDSENADEVICHDNTTLEDKVLCKRKDSIAEYYHSVDEELSKLCR